jgi:site-specific DNA-methyltransferase (adenine-specific)/modification methylase
MYKDRVVLGDCTLYLGDCMDVMADMPDKCVDAVITDPPYGIGIGGSGRIGGSGMVKPTQYLPVEWDDNGLTTEQFYELKRISTNQVIFGFEHLGGVLGKANSAIAWDKKLKNNWDDNFSDCEIAWTSFKKPTKCYRHLWMGALRQSETGSGKRVHPTQKPIDLMMWITQKYSDDSDTILDPFMGSGTTGVACVQTGRKFIGVEIDPKYFEIACKRIKDAQQQMRLPI